VAPSIATRRIALLDVLWRAFYGLFRAMPEKNESQQPKRSRESRFRARLLI